MNKLEFYFPVDGRLDGKPLTVNPYEFENFLIHHVGPLAPPMVFWSEVQHGDGCKFYHLTIIIRNTFGPDRLINLFETIHQYVMNFQTKPIMWNDQENCGFLYKDD